tara:strand:+ start:43 stop:297 length:255 start_codon:yes stop_codon:yes gene_type:complete
MPEKRSRKNIIVIKNKGDLTKYGYKNVRKLSRKKRHESLDKAVKQYGRVTVIRKLGAIRALHYNKDRQLSNKFYSDLKYVQRLD